MDYSNYKLLAQQSGTNNKCQLTLIGIKKQNGIPIYVFDALVFKTDTHFPNVHVFGYNSPFFITDGVSTINPALKSINEYKVRCEVKGINEKSPSISVQDNWESTTTTIKLPTPNINELPTQIIDGITDNPVEVVVCMDISGSMKEAFKAGDYHSKMEMATHSAEAFIHKLRKIDFLGICSFSSNAHHVWGNNNKTQSLVDDKTMDEAVKATRNLKSDGGGTNMTGGLTQAGSMLSDSQSSRKTIILLSDGLDSTQAPDEIQKATELKNQGIEIYTIAVGSDADKENLKKIAGGSSSEVKYDLIVSQSTIEMDSAFNHITHELGISIVHLNQAIKAKSGQAISNIHALEDYVIPAGVQKAYAAFVWDNHNVYKWIGLDAPSYPFPAKAGDISFSITKFSTTGHLKVSVDKADISVVQNKDGYVVLEFKKVEKGDRFEFGLFKKTTDDKHMNFSVSFYTPLEAGRVVQGTPVAEDDFLKIYGMTDEIASLLKMEGITSFMDIIDTDLNHLEGLIARHIIITPSFSNIIHNTWFEQAALAADGHWDDLNNLTKNLAAEYPKDTLFLNI